MDTVKTKVKARDIVVTFNALRDQRDEARAETTRVLSELVACQDQRAALRAEVALLNAAIENDAENRIRARDAVDEARTEANQARAERDALRTALTEVLAILKSGRSTGRKAMKALFAAEDVVMAALEPDTHSGNDEYTDDDEKYLTTFGGMKRADE